MVPYQGSGTIILTVVAQRPPCWTVDSVDPSLSGVTQQTMLLYNAGRVVGDCCSTMLKLSSAYSHQEKKKKEKKKKKKQKKFKPGDPRSFHFLIQRAAVAIQREIQ